MFIRNAHLVITTQNFSRKKGMTRNVFIYVCILLCRKQHGKWELYGEAKMKRRDDERTNFDYHIAHTVIISILDILATRTRFKLANWVSDFLQINTHLIIVRIYEYEVSTHWETDILNNLWIIVERNEFDNIVFLCMTEDYWKS